MTDIFKTYYYLSKNGPTILARVFIHFINFFLPIKFSHLFSKHCVVERSNIKLIVSLTNFPAGINKIWLVIKSLFIKPENQTGFCFGCIKRCFV